MSPHLLYARVGLVHQGGLLCSEKVGEGGRVAEQSFFTPPPAQARPVKSTHPPKRGSGGAVWVREGHAGQGSPSLDAECWGEGWSRGHQVSAKPRGGTVILCIHGFSICESA